MSLPNRFVLVVLLALVVASSPSISSAGPSHSHPPISLEDVDEEEIVDIESIDTLKTSVGRGEALLLELRNVNPTPKGGAVYDISVEILEPVQNILRRFAVVVSDTEK
ncbi:MAG: hypothetical protein LUE17_07875 [Planctomycetaceae bacterium]|nr:hypothetical protein [Planctomycetaceae bacterium]